MTGNPIVNWLNGKREYWEGVKLFDTYSDSQTFKSLFKSGPSGFNKSKLVTKLEELKEKAEVKGPVQGKAIDQLPDDLKKLYTEACAELNEMKFLHPKLEHLPNDDERFQTAYKIQSLHISQRFKFNVIDTFIKTGKRIEIPVVVTKRRKNEYADMNCLELAYQLQYLPQYIGKTKKKLQELNDQEEMVKLNAMLDQYYADIETVKNLLLNATISNK